MPEQKKIAILAAALVFVGIVAGVLVLFLREKQTAAPGQEKVVCRSAPGSAVSVWAPTHLQLRVLVTEDFASAAREKCALTVEFSESAVSYRDMTRDVSALLSKKPGPDVLMVDPIAAKRLAAAGLVEPSDATLFSVEKETGIDYLGISLVRPKAPVEGPLSWLVRPAHAGVRAASAQVVNDPVDDFIDVAKDTGESIVEGQVKDLIKEEIEGEVVKRLLKKYGTAAVPIIARANLVLGTISAAGDIVDLTRETTDYLDAQSDLDDALYRNVRRAQNTVFQASVEAAALIAALANCTIGPDEAGRELTRLEALVEREYGHANDAAADMERASGDHDAATRQMSMNDMLHEHFRDMTEKVLEALARRRAMGDCTPSPGTLSENRRPVLELFRNEFRQDQHANFYTIRASDPDGDELRYSWSAFGVVCGETVPSQTPRFVYEHGGCTYDQEEKAWIVVHFFDGRGGVRWYAKRARDEGEVTYPPAGDYRNLPPDIAEQVFEEGQRLREASAE